MYATTNIARTVVNDGAEDALHPRGQLSVEQHVAQRSLRIQQAADVGGKPLDQERPIERSAAASCVRR